MTLLSTSDYSMPVFLATAYGIVLVIGTLWSGLIRFSQKDALDFIELLNRVERIQSEASPFSDRHASVSSMAGLQREVPGYREMLRRMSNNSTILAHLAQLDDSRASPERLELERRMQRERTRLKLFVQLYRFAAVIGWYAVGTGSFGGNVESSYWSMVRCLYAYYSSHDSAQRTAALVTAFGGDKLNTQTGAKAAMDT